MVYLSLLFQGSLQWVDVKSALADVASKLTNEACVWGPPSRQELPAQVGFDSGMLFEEELTSPVATLQIKSKHCDGGNPRDGYLHDLYVRLQTKNKDEITFTVASYSGLFEENPFTVHAATLDHVELVRQAIRAEIGATRDRTMTAGVALRLLKEAQKQGSPLAQTWLDEALAVGPQSYGWSELLQLSQELRGKSPALLAKRLRETPFDEPAWRDASEATPASLSRELIHHMLSRFAPQLPKEATWRVCEDGVGPGLPRSYLSREVFSRLYPSTEKPSYHRQEKVSYFMRWGAGPLPVVRREETDPADQSALDYIWGEHADGCVIFWQKGGGPKSSVLGMALCITGDFAFQSRVQSIIAELAPFRWLRRPFDGLFVETSPRTLGLIDRSKSYIEQLAQMSSVMKQPDELMEHYQACQCAVAHCEHARKIDARIVAQTERAKAQTPAQSYENDAVRAVLDAFRYSLPKKRQPLDLLHAERQMARHFALCTTSECFSG